MTFIFIVISRLIVCNHNFSNNDDDEDDYDYNYKNQQVI